MLPLTGAGQFVAKNGIVIDVPQGQWPLLPVLCRLAQIGARTRIANGEKQVSLDGLRLDSPLLLRGEDIFYRETFVDDVYRIRDMDLSGRTVVDVGASVGDTGLAFAMKGARVYAFEPSRMLYPFLERNAAQNRLAGTVLTFNLGFSNRSHREEVAGDTLELVDGVAYTLEHLPQRVFCLKMDCEGCEYHLLGDQRFLDHLDPQVITMEYHHGAEALVSCLEGRGYRVESVATKPAEGYLYATRDAVH